ncbi:YqaE/Pmp3 family membrane protein [Thalassotalea ganghwensis]
MVAYFLQLDNQKVVFAFFLTVLGWIPGVVYSFYLVKKHYQEDIMTKKEFVKNGKGTRL